MVTRSGTSFELCGSMTALVTPFRGGAIDWAAVDALVDRQIEGGTDWVVPCGTTGESPTLAGAEQEQLLERVIARVKERGGIESRSGSEDSLGPLPDGRGSDGGSAGASPSRATASARAKARGSGGHVEGAVGGAEDCAGLGVGEGRARRCGVLAGTGSNSTAETVRKTKFAERAGADAAMLVAPYYNRPPQEGLFRHFAAVAEAVSLPLVLYNVPARTGVTISNDTVVRLRERFPNIVAIKDATGVVDNVTELLSRCDIGVLCGDDVLTWPMMALGGVGVISVISNLVPDLLKSLVEAALQRDGVTAAALHRRVYGLAQGLARFGPNPIPIKTAMAVRGLICEEFRLPLCPVDVSARQAIEAAVAKYVDAPDGLVRQPERGSDGLLARSRGVVRCAPTVKPKAR